ncbi:hypothetical protein GIB67_013842 [Kingdonia uniflora]|uniref:Uncharacterized protein n=1 Tax=Kingdonia uniflora TaxID=39325 RepID=A0A7J7N3P0_9MAGN|nr:hypothetical protein GIB67_013842 [Kingdonia uniflora]
MGLEIPEEFWPITPIQTIPPPLIITRPHPDNDDNSRDDVLVEGCVTPKSEEQRIKIPVECPGAPRKPRPTLKRKAAFSSQLYFKVTKTDLESVFLLSSTNVQSSKKIKAGL